MPVSRLIGNTIAGLTALAALVLPAAVGAQSAPSPYTSATRYDALHRATGTIAPDPDGGGPLLYAATRTMYDAAGRPVRIEKGQLTSWQNETVAPSAWPVWNGTSGFQVFSQVDTSYDTSDRKLTETESSGGTAYGLTQYSYDAAGRLECTAVRMNPAVYGALPASACSLGTAGSQGPDRITRQVYDAADQVVTVQHAYATPLQQDYARYAYTLTGKQASVIDANGNVATYGYDGHDRQVRWSLPSPAANGTTSTTDYEAYDYDPNGNRTAWRKRDGRQFTFTYDALNRVTSKVVPDGCAPIQVGACPPASATRDVYYQYDLQGHQMEARFDTATGSDRVETGYDGFGRPFAVTWAIGSTSRTLFYQYDADGNRTRITHPDGVYFDTSYDGLDRQANASWYHPSVGTVPFMGISYDAQGRRSGIGRASSVTGYGYDPVGRLAAQSQQFAGSTGNVTAGLAYNPAGQITYQSRDNDDYRFTGYVNVSRSYAVNGLNQYTSGGPASFTYDANGNLVSDGTSTFAYDAENRLIGNGAGVALSYDPLGRLWRTEGGALGKTDFLYDGDRLAAEYDGDTGSMRRRYMFAGEDEPILWDEGSGMNCGGTRFLHTDHQGSIIAVADCFGNRTNVDSYDEYGIPAAGNWTTSVQQRFQYTGQAWIPELGMYYYKARFYSPTLGRFMQTDPIGYKDQNNLYAYVANDPVNHADPTGLQTGAAEPVPEEETFEREPNRGNVPVYQQDPYEIGKQQVLGEIGSAIGRAFNGARDFVVRTYQTYTKTNPETREVYTGRTSGTGTPAQNIARRDANHQYLKGQGFGPARLDRSSSSPQAIRGREQQMIERNGGAQSRGGTSGNRINGVSPTNRNAETYRRARKKEFGE